MLQCHIFFPPHFASLRCVYARELMVKQGKKCADASNQCLLMFFMGLLYVVTTCSWCDGGQGRELLWNWLFSFRGDVMTHFLLLFFSFSVWYYGVFTCFWIILFRNNLFYFKAFVFSVKQTEGGGRRWAELRKIYWVLIIEDQLIFRKFKV